MELAENTEGREQVRGGGGEESNETRGQLIIQIDDDDGSGLQFWHSIEGGGAGGGQPSSPRLGKGGGDKRNCFRIDLAAYKVP